MAIFLGETKEVAVHPKNWPYCEVYVTDLITWQLTTAQASTSSPFYSDMHTFGASNSVFSKTADTYYTYVDITGSHGAMGTIIFPNINVTATGFYTIKLTTDGVVEEFKTPSTQIESTYRQFLGFAIARADNTDARILANQGYGQYRFYAPNEGIQRNQYPVTLRSVQDSIRTGTPVHQFNESLKVEVKCSETGTGTGFYNYGTVLCTSAPNL